MKLYYFTASYPYGLGEEWKANELKELVSKFDQICVIPFSYAGNFDSPRKLAEGVEMKGPLFQTPGQPLARSDIFRILFHRHAPGFFREFIQKRVYKEKAHFISWMSATMQSIRLLGHPVIRELIGKADKKTVLSFYWGKGSCEFLPFVDTARFHKVFVRMHRYDLFENVNNGYIPYRKRLLKKISLAAPSSEAGRLHLQQLYPEYSGKIKLFRLGTIWNGKRSQPSGDGIFRIVSCSYLSPVKRVHLMIESLRYIKFPVLWRHVGDGLLRKEMDDLIVRYGLQDKFIIEGMIGADRLLEYYTNAAFDIFVNVSESEGVPMSIMEVLSLGIPVMATHVGGNGEIVDDTVGRLLPANPAPEEIAAALEAFYRLPPEEKNKIRENAHRKCLDEWDARKLAAELAAYLNSNN